MDGIGIRKSFKDLRWYEWFMIIIMVVIAAHVMVMAFIDPSTSENPPWLTVLNFVSAICGVFCIFFCAKAQISNFIFGLINTVVYAIFLWYWHIYGTFCLEMFFYLPMNIACWINWSRHRDMVELEKTKAKKLTWKQLSIVGIILIVVTVIVHAILVQVNGNVAWLDAMTVAIGLVATTLELKRYSEQYILWLITDFVAVAMYIVQFDPVYLTKKSIYLIMAIIGLYNWRKLNKERNLLNE